MPEQRELKERGKFEEKYKKAFMDTLDLITRYTGIYVKPEFLGFEYRKHKTRFEIVSDFKVVDCPRYMMVRTIVATMDGDLKGFYPLASHEAGEMMYYLSCILRDDKYRGYVGETVGDFFFRLYCKKEKFRKFKIDKEFKNFWQGRYRAAAELNEKLKKEPFKEQVKEIQRLMFKKPKRSVRAAGKIIGLLDRMENGN